MAQPAPGWGRFLSPHCELPTCPYCASMADGHFNEQRKNARKRNDQAAIEALADRAALAVSDPTRSLADPGALDRSTNSGALVSLQAAANRSGSRRSSALGRSSDYSTGSSAVDSRHSTWSYAPC